MDYIDIIAVISGTGVLYYNTPVSDLTAMITIEPILRLIILQCQA
jgi:hypothetical protein